MLSCLYKMFIYFVSLLFVTLDNITGHIFVLTLHTKYWNKIHKEKQNKEPVKPTVISLA